MGLGEIGRKMDISFYDIFIILDLIKYVDMDMHWINGLLLYLSTFIQYAYPVYKNNKLS